MRGSIIKRGKKSWRLKFDVGSDPLTGDRKTTYLTVRGTKQDANDELIRQLAALKAGTFVEPTKTTLHAWLDRWLETQHDLSPKTSERYRQLIDAQISPHLGAIVLQKLRPAHVKAWHGKLLAEGSRKGGALAARTVGHAHRVLRKALGDAVRLEVISRNVAAAVPPPKVEQQELEILTTNQIGDVTAKLAGRAVYPIVVLALSTGMRRGELLALRWSDLDLDGAKVRVERSLEQTGAGLRVKAPKTKYGRRLITLPSSSIGILRDHRRKQLEVRMAMGLGKLPDEALVFPTLDGSPRSPRALTKEWSRTAAALKLPAVSFHSLRHTHASALIAAGVDVLTISRRLGHGSAAITLSVYGHLFSNTDDRAASVIDAALGELQ